MNEYEINEEMETTPKRESIARIILDRMSKAASFSEEISSRLNDRLTPVMMDTNEEKKDNSSKSEQEYPPLFAAMRTQLETIESSLAVMSRIIDRTEI